MVFQHDLTPFGIRCDFELCDRIWVSGDGVRLFELVNSIALLPRSSDIG